MLGGLKGGGCSLGGSSRVDNIESVLNASKAIPRWLMVWEGFGYCVYLCTCVLVRRVLFCRLHGNRSCTSDQVGTGQGDRV